MLYEINALPWRYIGPGSEAYKLEHTKSAITPGADPSGKTSSKASQQAQSSALERLAAPRNLQHLMMTHGEACGACGAAAIIGAAGKEYSGYLINLYSKQRRWASNLAI